MADQAHHSIGEVLSLLKEEYEDVTISKIRFLESQGLIDPERTPSGYRRFYDGDIERLRWILTQQRDNFLPLKVIKRRLEDAGFELAEASTAPDGPLPEPTLFARREGEPATPEPHVESEPVPEPESAPEPEPEAAAVNEPTPAAPSPPAPIDDGDPLATPAASVSLSLGELAGSAGVDLAFVDELQKLGLVAANEVEGGPVSYDHEALVVVKAAADFAGRGVEPRHLRMFKVSAEREAGLFEQLTSPMVQRGGDSRVRARAELNELARLGEIIHRSVLRRALGSSLD